MSRYYVYELVVTPGDKVCYVGKGSGKRAYEHRRYALLRTSQGRGRQKHLLTKLRSILDSGNDFHPKIVYETDSELDALMKERNLIDHYGIENLFNVATHALLGRRLKQEAKTRISERIKAAWQSGKYGSRALRRNLGRKTMARGWFPKARRGCKYRGVSEWHDRTRPGLTLRWTARITENGKSILLCNITDLQKALRIYDDAAERLHGVRPNGTMP